MRIEFLYLLAIFHISLFHIQIQTHISLILLSHKFNFPRQNQMLMFEFRFYFFILFSTLLFFGQARLFVWIPSNQLSQSENWIGEKAPCEGDNAVIGMDESADQGIELAILEEKLGINQLVLPENGILYFGHSAELGDKSGGWQCPKREPQDVLFRPKIIAPNFFDYANWRINKKDDDDSLLEEGLMLLDAEHVPSSQDSVHIDNVSKIGCDVPAKLRNFSLFGQSLSTKQIHEITLTIEGKFMFRIGSKLGADFQLNDQYQFRWPTEQVFINGTDNAENKIPKAALFGRPNSNFFEPQFSKLCQFVRCQPITKYCTQPINPIGQCCAQCVLPISLKGAMMKFQQNSLNFTHSKNIVQEYAKLAVLRKWLPTGAGISFVRIDNNELNPHYQLAVIGSASVFSESEFSSTLWNAFRKIQQRGINAHLAMDYQPTKGQDYYGLKVECSLQNGFRLNEFLHWLLFFSTIGAILCFVFRNEYRRNPRLRIFVTNIWRRAAATPVVRWRRERSERVLIDRIGEETNRFNTGGFLFEFVNRAFSRSNKPNNNEAEFAETISKEETLPEEKNDGNNE